MRSSSRSSLLVLVLATLLVCAAPFVAWSSSAGAEDAGKIPLIIGGEGAKAGELPSLVFVVYLIPNGKKEAIVCTGTVIAPRFVLTAAHCVRPENIHYSVENFRVITGAVNWKAPDRKVLGVVRTMSYPNHFMGKGDAALIELASPTEAPPMPLAARRFWSNGSEAEMAGWGVLRPDQHDATYLLHRAPTTVIRCGGNGRHSGQICAEDTQSHKTSVCYGDSGGPLLMRQPWDNRLVEVGVVHGGNSCSLKSPSLYTSTVPIFNWVRARMAEVGRTP